jgi:hypothetical protein
MEAKQRDQEMENSMTKRQNGILGLATLGLLLAAPVHAAPDFMTGGFVVARHERADEPREPRLERRDVRRDERRDTRREIDRDEPRGYGYGYERRQQQRDEPEGRPRDRR